MAQTDTNFTVPQIEFNADLGQPLSFGSIQPLMLFPVRLETRFFPAADGGADLFVRVYPDKVHVDTHEPQLTDEETVWGKHYWEEIWRSVDNEQQQKEAWHQLVERFDAPRAAWIAKTLRPLNTEDRPTVVVPPDKPLPIKFPQLTTKKDVWTRAPRARLLPKRWWVFGYKNGQLIVRALGNPIAPDLAAGPDPTRPFTQGTDGELQVDKGMKWMVDFAEAQNVGMGIRVRLNKEQAKGFDVLLVFGTGADVNTTDGTQQLIDTLDAHYYTDGLSFIAPGTPTNNTPDAPAGFTSSAAVQEAVYMTDSASFTPGDGSNVDVLSLALGLHDGKTATLARLDNAKTADQIDARHMNRALWPATWGYFLRQMIGVTKLAQTSLSLDDVTWAREHFQQHVRAFGPLPALRIGKQPYGVLPVTSLDQWKPKTGTEQQHAQDIALQGVLKSLRQIWRRSLIRVPTVKAGASDPNFSAEQNFADIFSLDGISSSYSVHHLLGFIYLQRLWFLMFPGDQNQGVWFRKQQEMTQTLLTELKLDWKPRLARATFSGWSTKLKGPVVQTEIGSETSRLEPNYIEQLLNTATLDQLFSEASADTKSLFHALLRHGMLLEYWMAAVDLLFADKTPLEYWSMYQEQELSDMVGIATPKNVLSRPVAGLTDGPIGDFLVGMRSVADPTVAPRVSGMLEFRKSLEHLQSINAAKLQRLFAGALDLCSHRLDAWITSFATKRLAEMRKERPTGLTLGCYGWVINLKPGPVAAPAQPTPADNRPLFQLPNNPGYTHAPSLAQAATVAVLRSGHITHADTDKKDLLAIDLTSERVRLAQWLLDGVRQGQPLGALLGYRFERRLQDGLLGQFIPFFREAAPLVAKKLEQTSDATANNSVESLAANNVVDGLVLQKKWNQLLQAAATAPPSFNPLIELFRGLVKKPETNQLIDKEKSLKFELGLLDDAVDAVSDALFAETVHQSVLGNPLRTSSTLEAIASGESPPPELDVVRTPRTGIALTHRIVALLSTSATLPADWGAPAFTERSDAEPILNSWVARLLGDPRRIRCLIEKLDPSTNAIQTTKEVRIAELRLSPLDFIFATEGSRDAQPSEIEQRVLNHLRTSDAEIRADDVLRINPGRGNNWPITDLSYGEFIELVRTARRLITSTRAIDASELALPESNQKPGVALPELKARSDKAASSLTNTIAGLKSLLEAANPNLANLRAAIEHAGHFGVAGAVPFSVRDALVFQANSIAKELDQRADQLAKLDATPLEPTEEPWKRQVARLRVIFGEAFVVLPRFTAPNGNELQSAVNNSTSIQGGDRLEIVRWFQRASRVREGVAHLDASLRYAEVLQTGEQLNLRIAQLPHQQSDRWIGLPLKSGKELSSSRFSLVIQADQTVDLTKPVAGMLIDEWVEVLPNKSETTGVVFQYDQPDAAPPQSILLAVPPDPEQPWNLWSLQQVLLETLDLARIRAVDPDALDEVGHYLPAMYFAVNNANETVSTNLTRFK